MDDLDFNFNGEIPSSKSEMIRALCLKSWDSDIKIHGLSLCQDVIHAEEICHKLIKNKDSQEFFFGDSALALRLFSARLSREKGEYVLKGSPQLFQRPHDELLKVLNLLGCSVEKTRNSFLLKTQGWNPKVSQITLSGEQSSQYLSALLLNSWELKNELEINYTTPLVSKGFFQLTLSFLKNQGMDFSHTNGKILIPPFQKINSQTISVDPDMSTAFTVAAWAIASGKAEIKNSLHASLQPDFKFIEILKSMGADINQSINKLLINKTKTLRPIEVDISACPDLFPVLVSLCAAAYGTSKIFGAPQLKWKESNRLAKAEELLKKIHIDHKLLEDGIIINGIGGRAKKSETVLFNSDNDHRWVMAAQVLNFSGYKIRIENPEAICKTAPELLNFVIKNQERFL